MVDYRHVLKSILDHAPFTVSLKDADGCYAMVNPAFAAVVGRAPDEIVGRRDADIFPPPVASALRDNDLTASGTEEGITVQESLPVAGSSRTFLSRKFPLRSDGGEVLFLCSISHELSPNADTAVPHLADLIPQLAWVAGADGTTEYVNSPWSEYTGIAGDVAGEEVWRQVLHPGDVERTIDRWNYSLRTGEPFEIEHRLRRESDGSHRWFLGRAIPLRDETDQVIRWFGTSTDIDAQKQLEESLKNAVDELTRSNRELEQFALAAAQNLEEPLRMVASYLQLLQDKYQGALDSTAQAYITFAVGGSMRMQELIDSLLAFSRIGRSADFRPVDFNSVVATATGELADVMTEVRAELASDILPTVSGDMDQLVLLMKHLVANAISFRSPDAAPRIRVTSRQVNGEWEFSVRDNGIGIEPHYLGRIFLPFQRLHQGEEYPGTGIGLATCRKIVEHHLGRMWAESHLGEGSTFYFTLPAHTEPGSHPLGGTIPSATSTEHP